MTIPKANKGSEMKFKRHLQLEHGLKQIDIAPLINVIFLLFLLAVPASYFTVQSGIHVKLPKAVTSDIIKNENIVITITGENIIYLNNAVSTIKELNAVLSKTAAKDKSILIKADRRSSVGRIVDVWDLCRNLGIERINIATNQNP